MVSICAIILITQRSTSQVSRTLPLSSLKMAQKIIHTLVFYLGLAIIPLVLLRTLYRAYATPLRNVPGPWAAQFTRLWYAKAIHSSQWQKIVVDLHRKHGPVVRISPNECSIDDPEAAKIIYRFRDQIVEVCSPFETPAGGLRWLMAIAAIRLLGIAISGARYFHLARY